MSGANQSKTIKKLEEMEQTNNSNTTNDEDVTVENTNTENNKLRDDTEGNLQLQIQEAIAATISRASRNSIPFEQEQINSSNSCTSSNNLSGKASDFEGTVEDQNEVLQNPETSENFESSEESSRENMLVDSEQETNLIVCSSTSNSHDREYNIRNLNNEEDNQKISEENVETPEVVEACDSIKSVSPVQENVETPEVVEASDSIKSVSPVQEDHLNNCVDNSQSENIMDTNVESSRKVEDTVVEHLQPQETVVIGSVRHSEDNVNSNLTSNITEECRDALQDTLQIENNVEDVKSKDSDGEVNSKHTANITEDSQVAEDTLQIENSVEDESRHSDDVNSKLATNIAEESQDAEDTLQIENNVEDVESKEPKDSPVNMDQTSCSTDYVIKNIENLREVPEVIEVTLETQEVDVDESKMLSSEDLPNDDKQENTSKDCISDVCSVDNIGIGNTESTLEGQCMPAGILETQETVKITSTEMSSNKDFPIDLKQTSNLNDGENDLSINVKNTSELAETSQTQENVKTPKSEVSSKENMLVDSEQETNLSSSNSHDRDYKIRNLNNEEDDQNTSEENSQDPEVVEESDSKQSTTLVQEDCLNNCVPNDNGENEMDIDVESSRKVENAVVEHMQTQEVAESSVSSHIEDDVDIEDTTKIIEESQDAVKDPLELENNVEDVGSEEHGKDLLINADQTSCSVEVVDIKTIENLREVQDVTEGTLEAQEVIDVSASKIVTKENLPVDNEQENTSSNCISDGGNVDNIGIGNTESTLEGPHMSEETIKTQEAVEITCNEILSDKDFPTAVKQTSNLSDNENDLSINVENSNKPEEKLETEDVEAPKRASTEVTEAPDVAIIKTQDKEVFPVIEIVEDESDNQDVVEVIDVDESNTINTKRRIVPGGLKNVIKSRSKNQYTGGVCIEILSDDDEVQIQEKVEHNSEVQQPAKVDIVETLKNQLEDILQQVKMLTSTEYLLFYLKLPPKWDDDKTFDNLSDTLGSKLENNEILIPDKNKNILKAIKDSIRLTSKNTVQSIVDRVNKLTIKEYLWLRSNLPTDCIHPNLQQCLMPHGSDTSQTILWLKTHLEESPGSTLLKHAVFNKYQVFCEQNNMHLMSSSRFGKLVKQVFPKLGQKRLRVKGSSAYYYVGIQARSKLDSPRLPKVSTQKRVTDENESVKCENKSDDLTIQFAGETILLKEFNTSYRSNQLDHQIILEDESNDPYRSKQLDGQTILVHDPLALLNIPTNDDKLHNDASYHQSFGKVTNNMSASSTLDKNLKITKSSSQFHKYYAAAKSTKSRNSTSMINNSVRKVKYKEYRHPSVQKVFKQFNTIVLPLEVVKLNISPSVALDNSEMDNWYAEHFKNFAQKLSSIVIKGRSQNCNVTFTCCNDVFEVSDSYAKQLNDLKENLSNIVVRKSENSSNYEVVRISSNNVISEELSAVSKSCKQTFQITKQLTNQKIKSEIQCAESNISTESTRNTFEVKHRSVENLCKKFKGIALPEEIFTSDMDPVIVLDSGEVIEWYVKQLDYLKGNVSTNVKNVVEGSASHTESQVTLPRQNTSTSRQNKSTSRQSRAKMMNFCEIDSSDYDSDNINAKEYQPVIFDDKNAIFLPTKIESPTVSVSPGCSQIDVSEITHQIASEMANEPMYTDTKIEIENLQQRSCTGQKRLSINDEDANEVEQKRRRFYCSKITISPNNRPSLSEQLIEQIPYFQEKLVEKCASPVSDKVEGFVCHFCALDFDEKKELIDHKKIHLSCKCCKRKLKTIEAMRQHLIKHCSLNSIKNKPIIKLHRIDSVPSILAKYARAFREPVFDVIENSDVSKTVNYKEVIGNTVTYIYNTGSSKSSTGDILHCIPNANVSSECMEMGTTTTNLNHLVKRTYSKSPRYRSLRILKPASKANSQNETPIVSAESTVVSSENQEGHAYQQTQPEPTFQLKNTISNNLNKILLLSNNVSHSQVQSPNILYGTLYVNNTSGGQSSPNICLNSPLYNPAVTTSGIDCAMNTNPSCSNPDLQQPPTFMQIVESPNAPVMQYTAPISQSNTLVTFEHQDHSYHQQQQQQQLFQVGNNIPNLNNIVFVSNNVPQITELQSTTVNTSTNFSPFFDQSATKTSESETTNYLVNSTETSNANNPPPPQGQFRIRVKSIQELR